MDKKFRCLVFNSFVNKRGLKRGFLLKYNKKTSDNLGSLDIHMELAIGIEPTT